MQYFTGTLRAAFHLLPPPGPATEWDTLKDTKSRSPIARKFAQDGWLDGRLGHIPDVHNLSRGRVELVKGNAFDGVTVVHSVQHNLPSKACGVNAVVEAQGSELDAGERKVLDELLHFVGSRQGLFEIEVPVHHIGVKETQELL